MSIIIVDDSNFILKFIRHILTEEANYTDVITIDSGEKALNYLQENQNYKDIDLVLMDVFMEGHNGILICKKIKAHPELSHIPVMIMTSDTSEERLQEAFEAGATDYLVKPIRKVELLARVTSAIKLKEEMDKVKAREKELLELKAKLELANRELSRLVSVDGLTGIPNRRFFDDTIKQEWRTAHHNGTLLSLVMIDIDCFKQYNDTYGHLVGDRCLQQVATALGAALKGSLDVVARYGGEEFAAILPNTGIEEAIIVAETLRKAVTDLRIPHESSSVEKSVTVSCGVATLTPKHLGIMAWPMLVEEADLALYEAKSRDRNQVVAFRSLM